MSDVPTELLAREVDFGSVPLVGPERRRKALARAKQDGQRVFVYASQSMYTTKSHTSGEPHVMVRTNEGWVCDCKGYQFSGYCKHLAGVEARAQREGWEFGDPAPLPEE